MFRFLFLLILTPSMAFADLTKADIDYAEKGVCKVISSGGMGTGFFYKETEDRYFIMTNAHVVRGSNDFKIRIYNSGYKTKLIPVSLRGSFYKDGTSTDVGILSVDKSLISGATINVLEFTSNLYIKKHDLLFGWGFPSGKAACFWNSRVLTNNEHLIEGTFPNIGGQSGGPVLSLKNDKVYVVGMVTWRFKEGEANEIGGSIASDHIIKLLSGKKTNTSYLTKPYKQLSGVCSFCGEKYEDHYGLAGKKGLYCPQSIGVSCGPNGCYPPYHRYNGRPYRRGGINFGIGIGGETRPQTPIPDEDLWIDRPDIEEAPEIKPDISLPPIALPEVPNKIPNIIPVPEEPKEKVAETSFMDNFDFGWGNLALLGFSFLTGGVGVPAVLARLGMRPLFARIIGLVIKKRIRRILEPAVPEEEVEYFEKEDLSVPLKKK